MVGTASAKPVHVLFTAPEHTTAEGAAPQRRAVKREKRRVTSGGRAAGGFANDWQISMDFAKHWQIRKLRG
jgi:hypothetical protein